MRNTNIYSSIVGVAGNDVFRTVLKSMQDVARQMAGGYGMYAGQSREGMLRLKYLAVGIGAMGFSALWTGITGAAYQGQLRFQPAYCDPRTRQS